MLSNVSISVFLKNIIFLSKYKIDKAINDSQETLVNDFSYRLTINREISLYNSILCYFSVNNSSDYKDEVEFLKKSGKVNLFPYEKLKIIENIAYGYDTVKKLPFIHHDSNKKLFFPREYTEDYIKLLYRNYIENEGILGGGYSTKMPHQYQSEKICVKEGDLVIDIGSAEALFSLDVVDKAKKLIVIEPDRQWKEPLEATFELYRDKVEIINKKISNKDSEEEIQLTTLLKDESIKNVFLKIDIEGYETHLMEENRSFFSSDLNINIACCTYHKPGDADFLSKYFTAYGYEIEFSDGYILYYSDYSIAPPYFRKGLIRAKRNKAST